MNIVTKLVVSSIAAVSTRIMAGSISCMDAFKVIEPAAYAQQAVMSQRDAGKLTTRYCEP